LVRRASLSALHKIKPPREQTIPIMVQTLQDADPAVVTRALHSMAEMGGDAVPALVEALNNDKAAYWSCLVLCEIGSNGTAGDAAPQAVEGLTKAVSNEDPEVRMQALLALGEFGPAAKSAAPTAIKALEGDEFDGARYAAAFALGKMGDPAAIQPLQKAFESEDSFQKMLAAQALARLEPDNEEIVKQAAEQMAHSLASKDPAERAAAARGLAEFGGSSEVTAPALEKAVADAEPEVILDAMDAFVQLGAKAVPRVKRGLTNEKLRHYAIRILTRIGPDAKQAAPDIIEVLKNDDGSDPQFRAELQFGLGSIGSDDASAVPSLVESLNSDNEQVRNSAIFALRNIGPAAGEAAAALRKNLKSEDKFLALISAWSLLAIQPDDAEAAQEAVPALIAGLSWDNENVQIESAKALGELGPAAKSAVPELEKVKGSEALQAAVDEALKKIQG
jgi:HEAT repeat protein